MKTIYITLYLLLSLSITSVCQTIYYYDDMKELTIKKVAKNSILPLIEMKILQEGYKYCELPYSTNFSNGIWNNNVDRIFDTKVFSRRKEGNYIYLVRDDCDESFGSILLEEWNFNNHKDALNVFKVIKTFEEKKFYSVVPSTYYWLLFKNKIFYILVEETHGLHEVYCLRDMLLKEVVKNGAYQTYGFSW